MQAASHLVLRLQRGHDTARNLCFWVLGYGMNVKVTTPMQSNGLLTQVTAISILPGSACIRFS